jgi:hypothetical protein
VADDIPARLHVQADHDGFICRVPRQRLGANSGWILPFWGLWTGAAVAIAAALTTWRPALLDGSLSEQPAWVMAAGFVGLLGWAPLWHVFDGWQAERRALEMSADAIGVTVGGQRVDWSRVERVQEKYGTLTLRNGSGVELLEVPTAGLRVEERTWLAARLQELHGTRERGGSAPDALEALRAE